MEGLYTQSKQEARVLRVQLPICDTTVTCEVAGEVSLPDYQPEIKRLLRVSATVQPPSHYVGGGSMEFSGTVDYCIYYTGNDGQMYCFPTSQDYSVRVPLEAGADFDLSDALVCYAQSEPETINSRVSGPRRMSVKCRLRSRVKAYGSCVIEEKRQGVADDGEERLLQEATTTVSAYAAGTPFVLSDEILLERDGEEDGGERRIVSGDAQVLISEASCAAGRVNCRGELILKLLLARDGKEAAPTTVWRKMPIDHAVALEGTEEGAEAVATGHCTELSLSMEDGRVACEAEVVLEVCTRRNRTMTYTSDLYAIGHESKTEMKHYHLPRVLRCINGNMTQSESLSAEELGPGGNGRVVDIHGTAQIEDIRVDRGRFVVSGKCRYTFIVANESEMLAKELERPFRYSADAAPEESVPLGWEGQVHVISARVGQDAERITVDAELGICLCLMTQNEIAMVSSMSVGDRIERPAGRMQLCYPSSEDTLWSIAKHYHVSTDTLSKNNHLPTAPRADAPDSLGDGCVVVI